MKGKVTVKLGKQGAIISEREVRRSVRADVAMVKWKRLRRGWSVELCAAWGGVSPRAWRNVEHGANFPTAKTLTRMRVGVNLTDREVLETRIRRKIQHLRPIPGSEKLFQ